MGPINSKLTRRGGSQAVMNLSPTKVEISKAANSGRLVKFILLGSGESGKSTILRQMQSIYAGGFDLAYREKIKPRVLYNIVEGCVLIYDLLKSEGVEDEEMEKEIEIITQAKNLRLLSSGLPPKVATAIKRILNISLFSEKAKSKTNYVVQDSWYEIAQKVHSFPTWGGQEWVPVDKDIILCRARTIGVNDSFFKVNKMIYRMIDVGGQKNERKKVFDSFKDDIDVVLYVQSLGEYNLSLFEASIESRFIDSLSLWKRVMTSTPFKESFIILFFNKMDIFKDKYFQSNIALPDLYSDFDTPPSAEEEENDKCELAIKWYKELYFSFLSEEQKKRVVCHVTTATSKSIMQSVIAEVSDYIIKNILMDNGLTRRV